MGTIGLVCCNFDGMFKFLVKPRAEVGCRDFIEIGPTIQQDYAQVETDEVSKLFWKKLERGEGVITDAILSEEGGRFYQEQNRNVIIEIGKDELSQLPDGYVWSDYGTLNILMQVNNVLNIQLRNMLSFLEI
jgi:oxidase EvaA